MYKSVNLFWGGSLRVSTYDYGLKAPLICLRPYLCSYRHWDGKTLYRKKVKCSGEHKTFSALSTQDYTGKLQDMQSFVTTKSDLDNNKNEKKNNNFHQKLRYEVVSSQRRYTAYPR